MSHNVRMFPEVLTALSVPFKHVYKEDFKNSQRGGSLYVFGKVGCHQYKHYAGMVHS